MRTHQRTLQRLEVFAGNLGGRQQPETRVDAIDRAAFRDDALDRRHAGIDGAAGGRVQRHADRLLVHAPQIRQGQLAGFQMQIHSGSPVPVAGVMQIRCHAGFRTGSWRAGRVPRRANR
ncbi:hypothetical protein G6F45_014128 [Rhizopus arrhizus]|nr:hypothetical protein G6F45_014128 [Rhizopus arrhizus]